MGLVIRMQRPRGGCVSCGSEVRSMKGGEWLCGSCYNAACFKAGGQ